ncbi:hypothetical protein [Nocardioides donggukensis]|uniref:Uncharacterized protein n=1 Tax=Nocardioides donggukensis TaxID=2774019 RepID=A0A927K2T9_9ACTN|nr:hypothetical protein [Nocardioides donggukensis]MBD8868671.1 hypothetical protein [Nocardioides donggukensis]
MQPDRRSCGAAVAEVARMVDDPAYAERVSGAGMFAAAVLARHRALTGPTDPLGRAQLPWPPALGTPPWAIARDRSAGGTRHVARPVNPFARAAMLARIRRAAALGPVPVYVGSRLLPRHVVLVLDPDLSTYDPAVGRPVEVADADFVAATMGLAGWSTPWFAVLPLGT